MAKQNNPDPANEEKVKMTQKTAEEKSPEPGTGTETQNNLPDPKTEESKASEPAQTSTAQEEDKPKFEKTMDLRFKKKEIALADGATRLGNVLQQYHKSTDPEGKGKWVDIDAPED